MDLKEVPPEWMWPFDEELEHWFDDVDRKRRAKYGGEDEPGGEVEGDVMENELAKGLR